MDNRYRQVRPFNHGPALVEKIIAALSYINAWIGFAWLIIAILTKNSIKPFLKYHIIQAMFLWFTYFVVCNIILGPLLMVLSHIPLVNIVIMQLTFFFNAPILLGFSLIQALIYIVIFYLVITSFQGQYSYLPWFSDIVKSNVGRG